ncbi:hypothetical protein BKA61DRAFT_728700 [Leptodontidium sp. MPI-SDFR-AT-0119]|nr:hypothetical protein BKA61DRAFT_728700 [Leptodontidium sp. MPI-SDFR-AT-0119]
MDCHFLDDLFLSQDDFVKLTRFSNPTIGDGNGFEETWKQNHEEAIGGEGDSQGHSPQFDDSVVAYEFDSLLNDGGGLEQPGTTETSFYAPLLPTSETGFGFGSAPLPWTHELNHQDPSNSFFPAYMSMSTFDESPPEPLEQTQVSPVILTPTSSNASSENGMRVFDPESVAEISWNNKVPVMQNIGSHQVKPGRPSHQDQPLTAGRNIRVGPSQAQTFAVIEDMGVASAYRGPQLHLPPLEHLTNAFESQSPKKNGKRGKKPYNTEDRKKVGQVRRKGACWQCQIRKTACSTEDTCNRCQAMTKDQKLAEHICLRQKLLDVYLSHSSIYEMIVKSQERNRGAIRFIPQTTEQISFKMDDMIESSPPLTLAVTKYERIYPGSRLSGSYTKPVPWTPPAKDQRALLPNSVIGIEQLENMSRAGTCKLHDPFLNHELHDKIDHVLLLCLERPLQQSVYDLVAATLRIVNLRSFLMHSLVFSHAESAGNIPQQYSYADPVLNQAIRAIALAGITKAEKFVLAKFNDLHRLLSLDRNSMTIAQTCLLRLMLVYRNDVLLCERSVKIQVKSRVIFAARLEKVKFMYRVAATTYGTLCDKTSSFGQFEWVEDMSCNDSTLANGFIEMGNAFATFCEHEVNWEQDEIFHYFIGRKNKQEERKLKLREE